MKEAELNWHDTCVCWAHERTPFHFELLSPRDYFYAGGATSFLCLKQSRRITDGGKQNMWRSTTFQTKSMHVSNKHNSIARLGMIFNVFGSRCYSKHSRCSISRNEIKGFKLLPWSRPVALRQAELNLFDQQSGLNSTPSSQLAFCSDDIVELTQINFVLTSGDWATCPFTRAFHQQRST